MKLVLNLLLAVGLHFHNKFCWHNSAEFFLKSKERGMNHHQVSKLNLGYISLFFDNDEVIDGFGESKHVSDVIAKFANDVKEYYAYWP